MAFCMLEDGVIAVSPPPHRCDESPVYGARLRISAEPISLPPEGVDQWVVCALAACGTRRKLSCYTPRASCDNRSCTTVSKQTWCERGERLKNGLFEIAHWLAHFTLLGKCDPEHRQTKGKHKFCIKLVFNIEKLRPHFCNCVFNFYNEIFFAWN